METLHLPLKENAYNIHIGSGLLHNNTLLPALLQEKITGKQVFVLSNPQVAALYLEPLMASLEGFQVDTFLMPDGEEYKTLATVDKVVGELLAAGHHRSTTLVALGGGVVGDTAGFVAASYQRGVNYLQLPTTLLSQVDSSVGGKTGVNHEFGKNMIGAFHQPRAVYIDTDTLQSLPARELSAGLAEVLKHGILADADYVQWIDQHLEGLRALDPGLLITAIKRSCEIKAAVVAEDEKERGSRLLLNFGHTFAHAIETGMGYGNWLHGEAVGAGMVLAADLSWRLERCSLEAAAYVKALVHRAGLPVAPPETLDPEQLLDLMARDKKTSDEGLRLVLLDGVLGSVSVVSDFADGVPMKRLRETLAAGGSLCEA